MDYDVSDKLPPDILKIVVRCLTKEYNNPSDALSDLHESQIYTLINPTIYQDTRKIDKNNKKDNISMINEVDQKKLENQEDELENQEEDNDINIDDDKNEYDFNYIDEDYDDVKEKNRIKLSKTAVILVALVIIIPLLIIGYKKIKNASGTISEPLDPGEVTTGTAIENTDNTTESSIGNNDNEVETLPETINDFFSQELVKKTGYSGNTAEVDFDVFYDGYSSLLAENKTKQTSKILFAVVDLENDKYSYLKSRQIGIAVRIKALKDTEGTLIIEAYSNGKVSANASDKVEIYDDVWTIKQIVINVGNIDRIDAYIEYSGINKVWLDSIELDILK